MPCSRGGAARGNGSRGQALGQVSAGKQQEVGTGASRRRSGSQQQLGHQHTQVASPRCCRCRQPGGSGAQQMQLMSSGRCRAAPRTGEWPFFSTPNSRHVRYAAICEQRGKQGARGAVCSRRRRAKLLPPASRSTPCSASRPAFAKLQTLPKPVSGPNSSTRCLLWLMAHVDGLWQDAQVVVCELLSVESNDLGIIVVAPQHCRREAWR